MREGRIHDLPHEVRVTHHTRLDLLLHLHEVGRAHAQVRKAGDAAQSSKAEWCLRDVWKSFFEIIVVRVDFSHIVVRVGVTY